MGHVARKGCSGSPCGIKFQKHTLAEYRLDGTEAVAAAIEQLTESRGEILQLRSLM